MKRINRWHLLGLAFVLAAFAVLCLGIHYAATRHILTETEFQFGMGFFILPATWIASSLIAGVGAYMLDKGEPFCRLHDLRFPTMNRWNVLGLMTIIGCVVMFLFGIWYFASGHIMTDSELKFRLRFVILLVTFIATVVFGCLGSEMLHTGKPCFKRWSSGSK